MANRLDVIVPVRNEAGNIAELCDRIDKALSENGIEYTILFVDDHSTDTTVRDIKRISKKYPVKILTKKGKRGKAYSILEGAQESKAQYVAMIDGDLQYPPEALPEMFVHVQKHGVVVANRKKHKTSFLRRIGSNLDKLIFHKLLHGWDFDTQSGLKVFHREIIEHMSEKEITPWTFDMVLVHTAQELGHTIGGVEIEFSERKNGESKIRFLSAAYEIGSSSVKLKLKKSKPILLPPSVEGTHIGSGVIYKRKKFITHSGISHHESALTTFSSPQKLFFLILLISICLGFILNPVATAITLVAILTTIYFLDFIFSLYTTYQSLENSPELTFTEKEINAINDKDLPIYTILCPLYKEANVLPHFVENITKLDYPQEKLDILLLLEESDPETQNAARDMNLPSNFRVLVVPQSFPKTKPKACNYGLWHAKGEYVVIYDAEDQPDQKQLRKAFLAFKKLGETYYCVQSKLNYYNPKHNLLTRLFTAEYSLWFDLTLPGLQSINTTIPLGGTSNHFRTENLRQLSGWDPFNVTEDCDLGVRLFKAGYKTAVIDSTTYEEANSHVKNWIRQRSRWLKGYFQTYLVHMRNPWQLFKARGLQAFIFQLVIGLRISFILINPILWAITISYFALYAYVGPAIESMYPAPVFYMGVTSLIFGNFMAIYSYMIGAAKRDQWPLVKYVFFIPVYWFMASIAAVMAFYQLITKPHYWEKTNHGLQKKKLFSRLLAITKKTEKKDLSNIDESIDLRRFARVFILSTMIVIPAFILFIPGLSEDKYILTSGLNALMYVVLLTPLIVSLVLNRNPNSLGSLTAILILSSVFYSIFVTLSPITKPLFQQFLLPDLSTALLGTIFFAFSIHLAYLMVIERKTLELFLSQLTLFLLATFVTFEFLESSSSTWAYIASGIVFFMIMSVLRYLKPLTRAIIGNLQDLVELLIPIELKHVRKEGCHSILILNWRDTKHAWAGGAEVYIHEIAKRWAKEGHSVSVFCGNDKKNESQEMVDGVHILRHGGFYTVYFWAFVYYLLKLRGRYDVVIDCENGIPFLSPIYAGVPVVLLIHHVHQDVFLKHLHLPMTRLPMAVLAKNIERYLMPLIYKKATVITISESSKKDILDLGLSTENSIKIVNPGINVPVKSTFEKTKHPSFSYVGRLQEYKNVDRAILAFAQLLARYPKAKLSIGGLGEKRNELIDLVNNLGISANVEFLGYISEEKKQEVLGISWAAIQPSSVEGWGITVIEANAVGTPVIASNIHGLKDSVVDGVTGILVPVKKTEGLLSAMITIIEDPQLRKVMEKHSRTWSKKFSWDQTAIDFLTITGNVVREDPIDISEKQLSQVFAQID